jgi:hypothetical protein
MSDQMSKGEYVSFNSGDIRVIGKIADIREVNGKDWYITEVEGFDFPFPVMAEHAKVPRTDLVPHTPTDENART